MEPNENNIGCILQCGRARRARGLCPRCYGRQKKAIRKGEITDEELVSQGKRLPSRKEETIREYGNRWYKKRTQGGV